MTPLAEQKLQAERLSARGELSEHTRAGIRRMAASAQHVTDVVDSLLEYADLQSGRLSVRAEDVDSRRIVGGVVDDFSGRAASKGIFLSHTSKEGNGVAHTDPRLVRVLVSNLVDDAITFSDTGRVGISVSSEPGGHVIRITDTAPWRVAGGPSLGLAIVRHVADTLGARLDLEPTSDAVEGKTSSGTTVTVTLPLE